MSFRRRVKRVLTSTLYRIGFFPSRWQLGNPFKIGEFSYLLRDVKIEPNDHILDIGCGKGIQTQTLARLGRSAVGIDLSTLAINAAEELLDQSKLGERVRYFARNLHEESPELRDFDHVFSISVIEHVQEYLPLLRRAYRLLKPGGQIHISVDSLGTIANSEILERHRTDHGVQVYFTLATVMNALSESGFSAVSAYPIFVGPFAREEFIRRIVNDHVYGGGPLWRYRTYRRLMREDVNSQGRSEGIFIIAHGSKAGGASESNEFAGTHDLASTTSESKN